VTSTNLQGRLPRTASPNPEGMITSPEAFALRHPAPAFGLLHLLCAEEVGPGTSKERAGDHFADEGAVVIGDREEAFDLRAGAPRSAERQVQQQDHGDRYAQPEREAGGIAQRGGREGLEQRRQAAGGVLNGVS